MPSKFIDLDLHVPSLNDEQGIMGAESVTSTEKPLSGRARVGLFLGAGASIAFFYAFGLIALVVLVAILGFELLLVLALARVGLAGFVTRIMGTHIAVAAIFIKSLWIQKGVEYRIRLEPGDAPGLFAILKKLCTRAEVSLPKEVLLEMNVTAWVRLKGYRRGVGKTTFGVGYDLLAGLTVAEVEAVLAHEITHAKLVQRGYKRWLNSGVFRAAQLAGALWNQKESERRSKQSFELAGSLFGPADRLTRLSARLVAACSRQDEFDADRGAAEICGSGSMRSALLKVEATSKVTARLPWRERVAQLQAGRGLRQWLLDAMATADPLQAPEPANAIFFKYSTHPSLVDRLAALPPAATQPGPVSPPAIELLAQPEEIAEKLVSEIQRVAAQQEEKDSKRLRRWSRKTFVSANLRPAQSLGVLILLICVLGGLILLLAAGFSLWALGAVLFGSALGILLFRIGRYRERLVLSVPDFAILKAAWQKTPDLNEEQRKKLESELRTRVSGKRKSRDKALALCRECYDGLSRCDYVRAHEAARLCLEADKKFVEGTLGFVISAAALGQVPQVKWAFPILHKATGMTGFSTTWGAGWALLLCGDWLHAEALLEKALKYRPNDQTILSLLALSQSRRGKLQSAVLFARKACTPKPANNEHAKLLIDLLLQAGYMREAREQLNKLEAHLVNDPELMLSMIRLNLLLRDFSAADEWMQRMRRGLVSGHMLVQVGEAYEVSRKHETAALLYQEALQSAHYPEALLGLGRLESERHNKEKAKRHILAALNLNRPLGERATGPLPLFHRIVGHLVALEDPTPNCHAWIAKFNGSMKPPALANISLLVYAPERQQAQQSLQSILNALEPGMPPMLPNCISWKEAPKDRQPDVPVRPGVQGVFN